MLPKMTGIDKIMAFFGEWPSFHDAEILELHLERSGKSWIKIYKVWGKQAVITFKMENLTDLELADFSQQNVIASLELEKTDKGIRLILSPCYGLAGYLEAERMSVEIATGGPS